MNQSAIPAFLRHQTLVLASGSPRRQELLRYLTEEFSIQVSSFDEGPLMAAAGRVSPDSLVEALAAGKAGAVLKELGEPENTIVIGGDTVVVSPEEDIFGKPADRADAARMLRALSGRTHRVVTGMALCARKHAVSFSVSTQVEFFSLRDQEIEWYLDTGEPFDKAGAYGIQGYGSLLVKGISGSYDNVVGMPVAELYRQLENFCQK